MELQLGLAPPTLLITTKGSLLDLNNTSSHTDHVEEQSDASTGSSVLTTHQSYASTNTPPLSLWNKHPKDQDNDWLKTCSLALFRNEEDAEGVVGWPPVKSCRKKHCGERGGGAGGLYVKAQMEGVVIIRKVDLSPHQSYHTLVSTLLYMFGRGQESEDGYTLTYQDMEGDWLLASDVPWRMFIESVQRLKLIRNEA